MKKQIIKRLSAFLLAVVCTATFYTMAYAAVVVYNNIELEHITTIEKQIIDGIQYTAVGGIAVGTDRTSMFVMKSEKNDTDNGYYATEQMALFYDYPNINNPSNRHIYRLPQAGHANGMTIDDYNIYVCGWTKYGVGIGNQIGNTDNNWIIKIPRNKFSYFRDQTDGYVIPADHPASTDIVEGYSVLTPIIDETSNTPFPFQIRNITKYNSNKTFLIQYFWDENIGYNLAYTTARLVTEGTTEKFYVSMDPEDVFIVENNVQFYDGTLQDICYSEGNGLFIPIWYQNKKSPNTHLVNENKNVIMWVDLSTTNNPKLSTITVGENTYRYYTQPDKINVNQSGKGYTKFEVESIAITTDDEMLFSANIAGSGGLKNVDSVFKMTHDNGQNFVLQ